jgi:hypothetical protein
MTFYGPGDTRRAALSQRRSNAIKSGKASPGTYPTKAKAMAEVRRRQRAGQSARAVFDGGTGRWRVV